MHSMNSKAEEIEELRAQVLIREPIAQVIKELRAQVMKQLIAQVITRLFKGR